MDFEYRGERIYRDGEFFAKNECDACRKLLEEDARPGVSAIARFWRAGKPTHDLEMSIVAGAKHYVSETATSGPRFRKYDPNIKERFQTLKERMK